LASQYRTLFHCYCFYTDVTKLQNKQSNIHTNYSETGEAFVVNTVSFIKNDPVLNCP